MKISNLSTKLVKYSLTSKHIFNLVFKFTRVFFVGAISTI